MGAEHKLHAELVKDIETAIANVAELIVEKQGEHLQKQKIHLHAAADQIVDLDLTVKTQMADGQHEIATLRADIAKLKADMDSATQKALFATTQLAEQQKGWL